MDKATTPFDQQYFEGLFTLQNGGTNIFQNSTENKKNTIKMITVQQRNLGKETKRRFSQQGNTNKLLQWVENKMDGELIHACSPFSYKSKEHKHFYNMKKKLQNLSEVGQVLTEVIESQCNQLKKQLHEFLFYKQQLIKKHEKYELSLKRLLQVQEKVKNKQIAEFESRKFSKASMRQKTSITQSRQKQESKRSQKQEHEIEDSHSKVLVKSQNSSKKVNLDENQADRQGNLQKQKDEKVQQEKVNNLKQELEKQKAEIEKIRQKAEKQKEIKQQLLQKLHLLDSEHKKYSDQIHQINQHKQQIRHQNQKLNHQLTQAKQTYQSKKIEYQKALNTEHLVIKLTEYFQKKKKTLHNQIQQLRGNIRVFCRIRPIAKDQKPMNYKIQSDDLLKIKKSSQNQKSENLKTDFEFIFDRIFDQHATQQDVFGEISQLVQSALDGYNVCIFAYGQTGSGKTFTMQGKKGNKQLQGVIPRSIDLIFAALSRNISNKSSFEVQISINEIYNDTLVNLLTKANIKSGKPIFTKANSVQQVENLLQKAVSNRSIAFTLSNADSSRSHLIFVLKIITCNLQTQQINQSHLILVDLAGSQRVKESGVSKQRLKQAQHINNSLSQLGQVIRSLKSNKAKTNFRNSKLTFFLQPYLQKGSKAIMFVNISPSAHDESQTINSLKFAAIAKQCKLQTSEN